MNQKFNELLEKRVNKLQSQLCVGLDPELEKLPSFIQESPEPLFTFCKEIVYHTHPYAVAYKPNIAFFERFGSSGILQFEKTIEYIQKIAPEVLIVADVKRGDLANTSKEYSKYYFENLNVHSITISPYMGKDSFIPYLENGGHIFLLCLTSNEGSQDYQNRLLVDGKKLYEFIAQDLDEFAMRFPNQIGIVVGATHPKELGEIRKIAPNLSFLIPGYGAQGGSLSEILPVCGKLSLVNSSRSILFASSDKTFGEAAAFACQKINQEMKNYLSIA